MRLERLAAAKVNLFLHVGPLAADGYHPLVSLVTFADVGDVVRLEPAPEMAFALEGRFGAALAGETDNLVTRARDLVLARIKPNATPFRLTLDKQLPIASGLGGGSSDAAATLMLLGERFGWGWVGGGPAMASLAKLGAQLGSDVPMCLAAEPAIAEGRGEELGSPPPFPDLDAVLVNPMVPSPTGRVYAAYDDAGAPGGADAPDWPKALGTPREAVAFLAGTRNDLEAPAISLSSAIGETLAVLRARPETLFARMSGSGATCFAICAGEAERFELARVLGAEHPDWWVRPCRLAGHWR
jgi:4-diphosphocytidyl-2-C-methyl-D-erythritol kinase